MKTVSYACVIEVSIQHVSRVYFPQLPHKHLHAPWQLKTLKTRVKINVGFLLLLRYKNNVLIDAKAHSEKYTAESNYNMHSLEIKK